MLDAIGFGRAPLEVDPTRVCELLVGLPDVNVLGVDRRARKALRVVIETPGPRPTCAECAGVALVEDRPEVELVDLAAFGRPVRLVWRKHRWECANAPVRWGHGPVKPRGSRRRAPR